MATTPSRPKACETSMPLIFACAYGLRTKATWSMFGKFTSSTYNPCPVSRRGSSLRLIRSPKYRVVIQTSILSNSLILELTKAENWRIREFLRPSHCAAKRCLSAFELPREDAKCDALVVKFFQADIAAEVFNVDAILRE